jgi:4'-phosphopantetheinyl transferase
MPIPLVYCLTQTFSDMPGELTWLGGSERNVLSSMRFPKRRQDWLLGRWTAKKALLSYPRIQARDLYLSDFEVLADPDGSPRALLRGRPLPVSISISHSHGVALCGIGPIELSVGCDIELVTAQSITVVDDFFSAEEISRLQQSPPDRRPLYATLVWSAKESALKVLREGLRRDTRGITIEFSSRESANWEPWTGLCSDLDRTFSGWWRSSEEYVKTVAANQEFAEPVFMQRDWPAGAGKASEDQRGG